jgi:hypothetical protein
MRRLSRLLPALAAGGFVFGGGCSGFQLQRELDLLTNNEAFGSLLFVPISVLAELIPRIIFRS